MPCNSDYMNPTEKELNLSRVLCLHDELDGQPLDAESWRGFHPRAYRVDISKERLDRAVAVLCHRLQEVDVSKYSLEMQMWWRDHQKADAERIKRKAEWENLVRLREQAKAKLTPEEIKALGL